MLAMFDLGNLVGMPAVGEMLRWYHRLGWPEYPAMFVTASSAIFVTCVAYTWFSRRRVGIAHH
jgi:hypothetical protein